MNFRIFVGKFKILLQISTEASAENSICDCKIYDLPPQIQKIQYGYYLIL